MDYKIRLETPDDYQKVEYLTRESFWDLYKPGCEEHFVLHNLRNIPAFIKELDFVVEQEGEIIGSIVYTIAKVIDKNDVEQEVLCMGPFCIDPKFQKQGIGSKLLKYSLDKAKELGYKAVVIYGNPDYYNRFGFVDAKNFKITTSDGLNFDAFMALELYKGSLKGIEGKFIEDSGFKSDSKELEEFEKNFPFKEKHITDTQLKL